MPVEQPPAFHTLPAEQVAATLGTDPVWGLSAAEWVRRQALYGPNRLRGSSRRTLLGMAVDQVADVMI
ncbi:MAG TPA: cation-transporting P-type ATPase, partial [Terriglobales bacterium]|nr:cation-transporting P-type ATPase [Terriglobales bacterium]